MTDNERAVKSQEIKNESHRLCACDRDASYGGWIM